MATLSATFKADFVQFEASLQRASVQTTAFDRATKTALAGLRREIESFKGENLAIQSARMVEAVNQIGGVSKLTAKEVQRLSATLDEAAAKAKLVSGAVPPAIAQMRKEIAALPRPTAEAISGFSTLSGILGKLGPLLPITSIAGAATVLVRMGTAALESAGQINDLANKTGLSVEAIQRMQAVANQTGTTIEAFTNAAFKLGVNVAEGTTKARKAVEDLGLSYTDLKNQKPEEQFATVVKALEGVDNQQERNRLGVALFGKQFGEIAASIQDGYSKIADAATVSSERQIKALDAAGDAWQKFKDDTGKAVQQILGNIVIGMQTPQDIRELTKAQRDMLTEAIKNGENLVTVWARIRGTLRGDIALPSIKAVVTETDEVTKALVTSGQQSVDTGRVMRQMWNEIGVVQQKYARETMDDQAKLTAQVERLHRDMANEVGLLWMQMDLAAMTPLASKRLTGLDRMFEPFKAAVVSHGVEAGHWFGDSVMDGFADVLNNLGSTFSSAFTGGGGFGGALKAIGVQLADGIMTPMLKEIKAAAPAMAKAIGIGVAGGTAIGAAFGGQTGSMISGVASGVAGIALSTTALAGSAVALGAATAGIGAAAVGIYMLGRHFFSVSKEIKEARKEIEGFQEKLQSTLTDSQRMGATESWELTLIAVRDAYIAVGKSAAEAERITAQLLNTDNPQTAKEAARQIEEVFQRIGKGQIEATKLFTELNRVATLTGQRLPDAFEPVIEQLRLMRLLTDEQAEALKNLAGEPSWQQMEDSAEALGIDLAYLGQGFDSKKLASSAEEMLRHFNTLRAGGMDVGTMLSMTSDQMSELVRRAINLGTELPEGLREYIEELARSGKLVDENGEALVDLSRLNFAEPLEEGIDRLIDKFGELIDVILYQLNPALSGITMPDVDVPTLPISPQASGGDYLVRRPTLFLAGEAGAERATFTPMSGAASGTAPMHVHVEADGRSLVDFVVEQVGNRLAVRGAR